MMGDDGVMMGDDGGWSCACYSQIMKQRGGSEGIRWQLGVVFLYYASYADRNNYKLLKSQNYRRFLIDSETVTDHAAFPPYDIAFRKIHTTAITQPQFQDLLPAIAQLAFPQRTRREAFEAYLAKHLTRLHHDILQKSDFGADVLAIQGLRVEARSLEMLESSPLRKAYAKYIQNTAMHQKTPEQTFEQLHIFLVDFDLSPKLIYKAMAFLAFCHLQHSKTNSARYEVQDFKRMLICVGELYWRRVEGEERGQEEKVLLVLQQMELSPGFKRMQDKALKETALMVSFFKPTPPRPSHTHASLERDRMEKSIEKVPMTAKHEHQRGQSFFSAKRTHRTEEAEAFQLLQGEGERMRALRGVFQGLCRQGEVANSKTLKSIKIKKYFQSINILAALPNSWLDLKVVELTRNSPSGKIEFPHFLQLLLFATKHLNITMDGLCDYLLENQQNSQQQQGVSGYSTKEEGSGKGKDRGDREERSTLGIFLQIERQLERIFMHYSARKAELTFEQLTHLLYDFDVFPAFISKSRLYLHFQQLGHTHNALLGQVSLSLHEFLQLLHAVSAEIGENLTGEEQALFMLERMQDSAGHRNILGGQGSNLIGDLRSRYSSIYLHALRKNNQQKPGFNELLEDYHPQ